MLISTNQSSSLITIAYVHSIDLFFNLVYHLVYFVQTQILNIVEKVQHVLGFQKVVQSNSQRNELHLGHLCLFFILCTAQGVLVFDFSLLLCALSLEHTIHQVLGHS